MAYLFFKTKKPKLMKTTTIYNLVILDESGSMESIKTQTMNGFNETIQTIRSAQKKFDTQNHLLTLVTFNSNEVKTILDLAPISKAEMLSITTYKPDSNTPLYDALGLSLSRLRHQINQAEDHQVLVSIITDGHENASREFTGKMVKNLIDELKTLGWVFTFIGANIDVEKAASEISINNYLSFNQTEEETKAMFEKEAYARMNFFDKMSKGTSKNDLHDNYFDKE